MKYRLVEEGKVSELNERNLSEVFYQKGFRFIGLTDNDGRLRKELVAQPRFSGLCGPMWDGDAIRYETQSVYDSLSR